MNTTEQAKRTSGRWLKPAFWDTSGMTKCEVRQDPLPGGRFKGDTTTICYFPENMAINRPNADFIALAGTVALAIDAETEFDGAKAIENAQELLETVRGCVLAEFGTMKAALDWIEHNKSLTYWNTAIKLISKCRKEGAK